MNIQDDDKNLETDNKDFSEKGKKISQFNQIKEKIKARVQTKKKKQK